MNIDSSNAYLTAIDADTGHETAEEMYGAYGAYISTEAAGHLCLQAIDYDWLDESHDEMVLAQQRGELPARITDDEALALIELARSVRDGMDAISEMLDEAVECHQRRDLAGCITALEEAKRAENEHGDSPATRLLSGRLLIEIADADEKFAARDGNAWRFGTLYLRSVDFSSGEPLEGIREACVNACEDGSIACGEIGSSFSTSGPGAGWSAHHDSSDYADRALSEEGGGATHYLDLDDFRLASGGYDDDIQWSDEPVVYIMLPAPWEITPANISGIQTVARMIDGGKLLGDKEAWESLMDTLS